MSCYFEKLGELYLSGTCTDEEILAVPLVEVKIDEPIVEVVVVQTQEADEKENTEQNNDVVMTPPVMSARSEVHRTHPPGTRSAKDRAPFDHLAAIIHAKAQEKESHVGKSPQRAATKSRKAGTLNLRKPNRNLQASEEADARYAFPEEVELTVFSVAFT